MTKISIAAIAAAAVFTTATAQKAAPTVVPEGEMRYYEMSAYLYQSIGLEHVEGLVNKVCLAPDGRHIYLGSIFPNSFRTADMWLEGTITTDKEGREIITIPSSKPFFTAGYDEIYVGEVYVDEDTYETKVKDVTLVKDGDHIYIEDDVDNYSRCLVAFEDDYGDIETVDVAYCIDLRPYAGNTTAAEVPPTAEPHDYIYYSLDTYGTLTANRSTVLADGDDYYFDMLMPSIAPAIVKGTRTAANADGSCTITVPADQFMGADCGYYLYSAAFRPTSYDEASGQYVGEACDITFNRTPDGIFTFSTPQPSFITALQNDGKQFDCVYESRIVPYTGDVPAQPSDPYEVSLFDYTATGAYAIDFVLNNISTSREYLNPEKLGYYIYLNGQRVTFTRDVYGCIHEQEMTLVPYAYTDAAGYDFYSAGGWNEVFVYSTDVETLGVQAVYTVDGVTHLSNVISVDLNGEVHTDTPVSIAPLHSAATGSAADSIFDLYGRAWPEHLSKGPATARGIRIENGKKIIR